MGIKIMLNNQLKVGYRLENKFYFFFIPCLDCKYLKIGSDIILFFVKKQQRWPFPTTRLEENSLRQYKVERSDGQDW